MMNDKLNIMKTSKRNLLLQRQIIEKKVKPWVRLRDSSPPKSGWIRAIRGALGMNTRQLAERVGVNQPAITQLENREATKKVTLDLLDRVASAMDCKLVYAIVPNSPYKTLDEIVDEHASRSAAKLIRSVGHSMQLEAQGLDNDDIKQQTMRLTHELKSKIDSRIWDERSKKKGGK